MFSFGMPKSSNLLLIARVRLCYFVARGMSTVRCFSLFSFIGISNENSKKKYAFIPMIVLLQIIAQEMAHTHALSPLSLRS